MAEAVVTDDTLRTQGFGGGTIEIVYSYRFDGELYAGLHAEPTFGGSGSEYIERLSKGRKFMVRVKPGEPDVSMMRDDDQGDGILKPLEQIDKIYERRATR